MLSSLVITFLPKSKHLLISWLQSPSAVTLEPCQKHKAWHCFHIYLPWSDGTRCNDHSFPSKEQASLISWLQSLSAVTLKPKKIKFVTVSIVSPSICHEVMGPDAMILVYWMLSFKPGFSLSSFTFIKRLFSSSSLSGIRVASSAYLRHVMIYLFINYYWTHF